MQKAFRTSAKRVVNAPVARPEAVLTRQMVLNALGLTEGELAELMVMNERRTISFTPAAPILLSDEQISRDTALRMNAAKHRAKAEVMRMLIDSDPSITPAPAILLAPVE
jgi:hypothetical protein